MSENHENEHAAEQAEDQTAREKASTKWAKGKSGNPNGRPKGLNVKTLQAKIAELEDRLADQGVKGELKALRARNAELEREAAERAAVPAGRVRDPGSAKALEQIEAILRDCAAKREGRS